MRKHKVMDTLDEIIKTREEIDYMEKYIKKYVYIMKKRSQNFRE